MREFIERDLGEEGMKRSVVVVATSDKPALIRNKAAKTATAIAEYFRDQGKDVLLMMDSLTRFSMAQREIGLASGEPPVTRGYPPSVYSEMPKDVYKRQALKLDGKNVRRISFNEITQNAVKASLKMCIRDRRCALAPVPLSASVCIQ